MNRKQFIFTVLLALLSGLMGGVLSIWFLLPQSVLAQDEPQKVMEAEEFRVVDAEGNVQARFFMKEMTSLWKKPYLEIYDDDNKHEFYLSSDGLGFSVDDWPRLKLDLFNGEPLLTFRLKKSTRSQVTLGFWPNRNEPSLNLYDEVGNLRAVLGTTELKHNRTGSTEIRATSSLVLFDEDGKVLWSAP